MTDKDQKQDQSQEVHIDATEHDGLYVEAYCRFLHEELLTTGTGAQRQMAKLGNRVNAAVVMKTIYKGKTVKIDCHLYDVKHNKCLCSTNTFDDNRCYLLG